MPSIKVLYFASVAENIGTREEVYPLPCSLSMEALKDILKAKHPPLKDQLERCRIAINQEFIEGDLLLKEGDEVAIIPPVSGG